MSWTEFQRWAAFDALDPIGGRRDDLLAAHWMATFVNMHRDHEKFPNPFPLTDFILVDRLRELATPVPEVNEADGAVMDPLLLTMMMAHAKPPSESSH